MVEIQPRMSTLNPNAPLFVPASYLATEDFSAEWWNLIQTSPAFRDYWLRDRYQIMEVDAEEDGDLEEELAWKEFQASNMEEGDIAELDNEKEVRSAFADLGLYDSKSQQRVWREPLKHHDKIVNRTTKSPRKGCNNQFRIQQPRA